MGPLHGIKVIELAGMGVVPYAGMLLGDLGADVIRVDRATGDPFDLPENRYDGRPTDFILRRSRRSIAVDLKAPAGRDVVLDLVSDADAIVEGFRPGVVERLGIGPDDCLARNPRLVFVRATGWGQTGPYAHAPGHDLNYVGLSGALLAMGRRGSAPPPPLNLVGDFAAGSLFAVVGMLGAILHARSTGEGQVVDASMIDGLSHLTAMYHGMRAVGAWNDERESNLLDGGSPFYDVYLTSDDRYMSVAAGEPQFVAALLDDLGVAGELADVALYDRSNWRAIRTVLAREFRTRSRDEWTERLAGNPVQCCAPVLSFDEAPHNVHVRSRDTFFERDGVLEPRPAPRFSATPATSAMPPAVSGEHSVALLEACGYDRERIDMLLRTGAVRQAGI